MTRNISVAPKAEWEHVFFSPRRGHANKDVSEKSRKEAAGAGAKEAQSTRGGRGCGWLCVGGPWTLERGARERGLYPEDGQLNPTVSGGLAIIQIFIFY